MYLEACSLYMYVLLEHLVTQLMNTKCTRIGNKTMSDVKRLYFKLREEVFSQTDMARRSQALDGFLQAHLGTQMKMIDRQHPK